MYYRVFFLLAVLLSWSTTSLGEPTRHRAPPAPGPTTHRAPPASSSSKSSNKSSKSKRKRKRKRGGGAGIAGGIAGAIGGAIMAGMIKGMIQAAAKASPPRTRHTGFFDVGGGYGGLWNVPGTHGPVDGSGAFRFKLGYRSRPLGQGAGMALELAFAVGYQGLGTGTVEDGGYGLSRVGGELRLYGQARHRVQPYVQGGCAYHSLDDEREMDGVGLSAGGGLQIWATRNLAIDLNLLYDGVFLVGLAPTLHGVTFSGGLKVYF